MAVGMKTTTANLHIRLLYTLIVLLLLLLGVGFWWGFSEIQKLRTDIEGRIVTSDFVEFNVDESRKKSKPAHNGSVTNSSLLPTIDESFTKERRRKRRQTNGRDESGTDDWVWLSSYSRIPIHVLDEFCRSMKDNCPAGREGPQGIPGIIGAPGIPGGKGEHGNPGQNGVPGQGGMKGKKGEPGVFGLKGDPGNEGKHGKPGMSGPKGEMGLKGDPGVSGKPGEPGKKGDKGNTGLPGVPGKNGIDGTPGKPGRAGSKGAKGARGLLGFPGFKGEPGEPLTLTGDSMAGPPGKPGPVGPPGLDGLEGLPGEPGYNGTDGEPGKRGKKGRNGDPGMNGLKGETGEKGGRGPKGDTGFPGLDGADGQTPNCSCPRGFPGKKGGKGIRGLIGFTGYKGERGDRGPRGPPGYGLTGRDGEKGEQGPPAKKGQKGEPGYTVHMETDPWTIPTTPEPTTTPSTPPPTIPPRERDCFIEVIGTPLFQRYTGTFWGSWMRDPGAVDMDSQKYWYTKHFTGHQLQEYNDAKSYKDDKVDKTYDLGKHHFYGTGHVIYQGSFYYHYTGTSRVVKFNMATEEVEQELELPGAAYSGNQYVYSTEYNYFDFSVDENGLWVVYAQQNSQNSLTVSKLDPDTLEIMKTWNLMVDHRSYGNGFITCGVLYLVKSVRSQRTVIDYAYDLYVDKELANTIRFINPYLMNHMISYNPKEVLIYGWDMGNQITYPLKFY